MKLNWSWEKFPILSREKKKDPNWNNEAKVTSETKHTDCFVFEVQIELQFGIDFKRDVSRTNTIYS